MYTHQGLKFDWLLGLHSLLCKYCARASRIGLNGIGLDGTQVCIVHSPFYLIKSNPIKKTMQYSTIAPVHCPGPLATRP